jgi:hypothetical protein
MCDKHLPGFLIAGAQKAGTTFLWSILRQHPEVFLPSQKEINFFESSSDNYEKGAGWYRRFFLLVDKEKAVGEASPRYMFYSHVAERIYKFNKNMKLILVLRNPVTRAESHYLHNVKHGIESLGFSDALISEEKRIKESTFNYRAFGYVARGMYSRQIKEYLKFFDKESILILVFEDLIADPEKNMRRVHEFLGVPEHKYTFSNGKKNERSYVRSLTLNKALLRCKENARLNVIAKYVVPTSLRRSILERLRKFNRKGKQKNILNKEISKYIYKKTAEDIDELESKFELLLEKWKVG